MGHEEGIEAIRAFLHTIWWWRVDLYGYSSCLASSRHLFDYSNPTMTVRGNVAHGKTVNYAGHRQMEKEEGIEAIRAFLHTIWWRRVDLYSYNSYHFD